MTKNRITAVILIVTGVSVFVLLAVIMMVLRQPLLATILFGGSLIVGGVMGLITAGQSDVPFDHAGSGVPFDHAGSDAPAPSAPRNDVPPAPAAKKVTSSGVRRLSDMIFKIWNTKDFVGKGLSTRALTVGGVFLSVITVLLLCNLLVAARPLFTVRETDIVECKDVADYTREGWQVVLTYSYEVEEQASGELYNACVIERDRFVWAGGKRASKTDVPANIFDVTPQSSSQSGSMTPSPTTAVPSPETQSPENSMWATPVPTQTPAPTKHPTETPRPTPTPTATLLPTATSSYPPDSPISTPAP